ncbi:MAG TPA: hypothetical protein VEK07_21870 [Polyangiaceae bacterium]|nr:hypothetical protein [Polyangiaceae bacterium]
MESLVTYLVAAMVAWVPPYAHAWTEPEADVRARYESIAHDLASVVLDESESPLFTGRDARTQTALLMLSVASFESSFRKSVDDGIGRGDGGRSYCLMQIRVGAGLTREGWTGPQLIEDRRRCFRAALHILHSSFGACHALPLEDRLSAYATGHCITEARISRSRVGRAKAWWTSHAAPPPPSPTQS